MGGSVHRNTAKKINEYRITARKVNETPSPQHVFSSPFSKPVSASRLSVASHVFSTRELIHLQLKLVKIILLYFKQNIKTHHNAFYYCPRVDTADAGL